MSAPALKRFRVVVIEWLSHGVPCEKGQSGYRAEHRAALRLRFGFHP